MERKILIIDDEESLVHFIENILLEMNEEEGKIYKIEKAYNGRDGLNLAMDFKPDVVLLDLKLPDMSGTEILSKLKQNDSEIQVVIMTAHASINTAIHSIRQEAYDYIQKPLPSKNHLITIVENAMERRQLLLDKKKLLIEISEANEALEEANRTLQDEKLLVDKGLERKIHELSSLNKFTKELLLYNDLSKLIEETPEKIIEATESNGVILILEDEKKGKYSVHSIAGKVELQIGDPIKAGEEPFGLVDNEGPWETEDYICSPLLFRNDNIGIIAIKKKEEEKLSPDLIQTISASLSISLHNAMLYDTLKASYMEAVLSLIMVQEVADPSIKEHSERVSDIALKLSGRMGLSEREKRNIRYAALLHDLGKLSKETSEAMSSVTKIISPFKFLSQSSHIIQHLYENFDGTGKPDGKKGNQIPVGSRIIKIAKKVDELRAQNKEKSEIISEIESKGDYIYDPNISKILEEIL